MQLWPEISFPSQLGLLPSISYFVLIIFILRYVSNCRMAQELHINLESSLVTDNEMYSLDDFCKTKSGSLGPLLRGIISEGLAHVRQCELCQARAYICEGCHSNTFLFPFQVNQKLRPMFTIFTIYSISITRLAFSNVPNATLAIISPVSRTKWAVSSASGNILDFNWNLRFAECNACPSYSASIYYNCDVWSTFLTGI